LDEIERMMDRKYRDYGLESGVKLVRHPWEFEFASYILVPVVVGDPSLPPLWKLSPKPGRAMIKLAGSRMDKRSANLAQDVNCLWVDGCHVPFLWVVLRRYRELLRGVAPKGRPDKFEYKIHAEGTSATHELAWSWMEARYGLGRADESDLEDYLLTVKSLPCVVEHRVLTRLIEIDVPL
jgi:hypothetical protein